MSRIMTAHGPVRPVDVAVLSVVFGWAPKLRDYLCQLAARTEFTHWIFDHADTQAHDMLEVLESVSSTVTVYAPLLVPRCLRVAAYDDHIRSEAFDAVSRPVLRPRPERRYEYFLDAHVLTRPGIPEGVRQRQLAHLLRRVSNDNATIRVVPANAHYSGIEAFRLLAVMRGESVVHLEQHTISLLLHHHTEVTTYAAFARTLRSMALDPTASRHFIAGLLGRSS
ncbi:Scr1 family TA system antitoxin-like transcriptional regulator [Actinokineospora sp. HUAS TT18]|uniref:Scr1 family TA system antitoxin-like transcriptional regulator n=1 Tax=Actinokineospora sp. HUAS TT18 TaxID=3447451 RepID=UPI003F5283A7